MRHRSCILILWGLASSGRAVGFPVADNEPLGRPVSEASAGQRLPRLEQREKIQGVEELRVRAVGLEGVFLVYDAANPEFDPRPVAGYLAYWNDFDRGGLFVYPRLLHRRVDVGQALLDLERGLRIEIDALAVQEPELLLALGESLTDPQEPADWSAASKTMLWTLMGFDPPDGLTLREEWVDESYEGPNVKPGNSPVAESERPLGSELGEASFAESQGPSIAKPDRRPEEAWGESPIEHLGDPVSPTDPNDPIGCAPDIPVAALDPLEPPGLFPTPQRVYEQVILQSGCCECTTGQDCRDDNLCTSQHICHCTCEYRYHCPTTSSPCGSQSCDPNIGCVTVPVNCDDDNPCTYDSCDPGFGCVHTPVCPDPSDACTTRWCDAPAGGVCRADPVDCDDDNPCTTDWCELPAGCRNECAGVCCDGVCCAAGQTCCGGTNCCTPEHCCNSQCCAEPCEGCILHGSISGGSITVDPDPPCFGDMLFFTLNGAADSGGLKWEDCSSVPVQPVPLAITWQITKPSGTVVSGSGDVAVVEVDEIGTYTCVFMASANRECPPAPITIGPAVTQLSGDYPVIEIKYKTFIQCEVVGPTPWDPTLFDFFAGDNRLFGYAFGVNASRTFQLAWVTIDPANLTGQMFKPLQRTGITKGYNDDPDFSDVTPLASPYCAGNCAYTFVQGATPECIEQHPDPSGAGWLSVEYARQNSLTVDVTLRVDAHDQCESAVPAENSILTIRFRQRCENGALLPVEFMAWGSYDGYPWYELYLNGAEFFRHDVCLTSDTPFSMFPAPLGTQYQFQNQNPALQSGSMPFLVEIPSGSTTLRDLREAPFEVRLQCST